MKKICVITCYKHPDYVRGEVLAAAIEHNPGLTLVRLKNRHKGILRYPEVLIRLIAIRLRQRPDAYILTFRGYEILFFVRIITVGRKLIFDEFINPIEWAANEHQKISHNWLISFSRFIYRLLLRSAGAILSDTKAHAQLSSDLMSMRRQRFYVVPVGADEKVFKPKPADTKDKDFEVFFYGNMLPLHGMKYILEALKTSLAEHSSSGLKVTLIGGKGNRKMIDMIEDFITSNGLDSEITYMHWADYKELPEYIARADLCLGGPFGNTPQAKRVITGKTFQFLAMGKPVLIGENKENDLFKDKANCLIVKQGSARPITDAIGWALKNRAGLADIGRNGRKLFEEEFSEVVIAKKLSEIINNDSII